MVVFTPLQAAFAQSSDWPCVQRLVASLEGGQMWAGPPLPAADTNPTPEIDALARELADLDLTAEAAAGKVRAFAGGLPENVRAERLTQLFGAALATLNRERAQMIEGIKRYARRQQLLAERIAQENRELDALRQAGGAEPAQLAELQAARTWDTRVHTDRQRQLRLVCEQPVRLEQRAFALARTIQEQLP
jgi:hypothetical protein